MLFKLYGETEQSRENVGVAFGNRTRHLLRVGRNQNSDKLPRYLQLLLFRS